MIGTRILLSMCIFTIISPVDITSPSSLVKMEQPKECPTGFSVYKSDGVKAIVTASAKVSMGNMNTVCEVTLRSIGDDDPDTVYFEKDASPRAVELWNKYYAENLPRFATAFSSHNKDYFPDIRVGGEPSRSSADHSDEARAECMIAQARLVDQGWFHTDLYEGSGPFNAGNFYHYNVDDADLYLPLDIEELVEVSELSDSCREGQLQTFTEKMEGTPVGALPEHSQYELRDCVEEAATIKIAHNFYTVIAADAGIYNRIAAHGEAFLMNPEPLFMGGDLHDLIPKFDPTSINFMATVADHPMSLVEAFQKAQVDRARSTGRMVLRFFFTEANRAEYTWRRNIYSEHHLRHGWRHLIQYYLKDHNLVDQSHETLKVDLKDLFTVAGIARNTTGDKLYYFNDIEALLVAWLR